MFTETETLLWKRVQHYHKVIGSRLLRDSVKLDVLMWRHDGVPFEQRLEGTYTPIKEGGKWGANQDRVWFKVSGCVPSGWLGERIVLWMDTGTEALVYKENGTILHGLTAGGFFTATAWKMSRPFVDVTDHVKPGGIFTFWVEARCLTHPWEEIYGDPVVPGLSVLGFPNGVLNQCRLGWFDETVWHLYMDMEVLIGLCDGTSEKSPRHAKVFRLLNLACDQYGRDANDFEAVRRILKPALEAPANCSDITVWATGHSHLDTAWLWTLDMTRQKLSRTFSNQLDLLDRYPDYIFGASSGIHYEWVKKDFPQLYDRICAYIREGRWEIQGAMWVEADTSIPSGESLVRQFLYGKNFFKKEFGQDIDLLWLPDVFGYSAALPQIMQVCGVRSLLTQKISWSQFNKFPHHTFLWTGIDGTETLVHFPPENNYCSSLDPKGLIDGQERFAERDRLDKMLSLFGYGDGGGGPTAFHLERALRLKNLEGAPKVQIGRADELFDYFHQNKEVLNRWTGELYLELHRKTLTTQAFIKKANRRLEERLTALEMLCSMNPENYPQEQIEAFWKILLLNQFHDIIPGSSVREVYEESGAQFDETFAGCEKLEEEWAADHLRNEKNGLVLFNALSIPYDDLIELPPELSGAALRDASGNIYPIQRAGDTAFAAVSVPAFSLAEFRVVDGAAVRTAQEPGLTLENELITYRFNTEGRLISACDRKTGREFMMSGQQGNALNLYNDCPVQYDAWDHDIYYENELIETARCVSDSPVEKGPAFTQLRFEFAVGSSTICQTVRLRNGSRRLDFITEADWKETRRLLRVGFPTAVFSTEAAYDIQYGYLKRPAHRNTSREEAMFEVCGHRYADLSQADFGVALLNDCKYGYKVYDSELSLSLLASPLWPDPQADRGQHSFTYSLLPHNGALVESEVRQEADMLNRKPRLWMNRALKNSRAVLPVRLEGKNLRVETVKKAENEDALIVRITETAGCESSGLLHFAQPAVVSETNAIEWAEGAAEKVGQTLTVLLKPFQIRTWRVVFG